jgi:hypothetical protein
MICNFFTIGTIEIISSGHSFDSRVLCTCSECTSTSEYLKVLWAMLRNKK